MKHILFLAWRYLAYDKIRTAILILALTVTFFLPVAVRLITEVSEDYLTGRSDSTPLVLGARGSSLDLVMSALYFKEIPAGEKLLWADIEALKDTELAHAVPIHSRYTAQGFPVIGTNLGYFSFRNLEMGTGRMFASIGECILGSEAAERLGLSAGDKIITDSENPFDLAGTYPLRLSIVGVLDSSAGWDDKAIFCDIKTAWVIGGSGHGHEDLAQSKNTSAILKQDGDNIVANAALVQYNEITPDNIKDFHFHGDIGNLPVTSSIVLPHDAKSEALLLGRYGESGNALQLVEPDKVIVRLLDTLFRIREILGMVMSVTITVTLLAVAFILALTVRLRKAESETLYKIGGGRSLLIVLTTVETVIVAIAALIFTLILVAITWGLRERFLELLVKG
jgi:putative ABC transport system permease protein